MSQTFTKSREKLANIRDKREMCKMHSIEWSRVEGKGRGVSVYRVGLRLVTFSSLIQPSAQGKAGLCPILLLRTVLYSLIASVHANQQQHHVMMCP